jgi:hypothetical protein
MLTRGEDYAHQQPSLTANKLRKLELKAGAPRHTKAAAGISSVNRAMRAAEKQLAEQAEVSYKRLVQDQQAGAPAKKVARARHRSAHKLGPRRASRAADSKLLTSALRYVSHPRPPTT